MVIFLPVMDVPTDRVFVPQPELGPTVTGSIWGGFQGQFSIFVQQDGDDGPMMVTVWAPDPVLVHDGTVIVQIGLAMTAGILDQLEGSESSRP